jgi:hypothetical protein
VIECWFNLVGSMLHFSSSWMKQHVRSYLSHTNVAIPYAICSISNLHQTYLQTWFNPSGMLAFIKGLSSLLCTIVLSSFAHWCSNVLKQRKVLYCYAAIFLFFPGNHWLYSVSFFFSPCRETTLQSNIFWRLRWCHILFPGSKIDTGMYYQSWLVFLELVWTY